MKKQGLPEQVAAIRQAFGYITAFREKTFVIKLDDSLMALPFFALLIRDIVSLHRLGIRIVIVPGARKRINELLRAFGVESTWVDGVRVSSPDAMPFIGMAASDVCSRIMTLLAEHDASAVEGNWVRARAIGVRDGTDFHCSGLVEKLKTDVVRNVLDDGLIPVFPNIGWSANGRPYNISSNELALCISRELGASKLFFVCEHDALVARKYRVAEGAELGDDGAISGMTVEQAQALLKQNRSSRKSPQLDLVEFACQACRGGVERVHIVDGRIEGVILKEIFSNRGLGTMVYANQHENVRAAVHTDIAEMLRVMQPQVEAGALVPRTAAQIEERLTDFVVYEVDGTLHGCAALHAYPSGQAEIAGVVVDNAYASVGIGRKLVSYLSERARGAGVKRLFALTTRTSDWFHQLGFGPGDVADLPPERQATYDRKRHSRVLILNLRTARKRPH